MPRALPALAALAILPAAAGCGGGAGKGPADHAPRPPALRFGACAAALEGFRCAALPVPLRRRGRGAHGMLRLAIAVSRKGPAPRGDLLALAGGPGQPGLGFGPRLLARLGGALRGYRVVVVDQRGTGAGAIRCAALQRAVGTSDLTVPHAAAVRACAQRLDGRRDVFATADTVADLEALRAALRSERWTLFGVSYGAFVAERYALAHPRRVRGLVLDSVVPQDGADLLDLVPLRATARVLRAVCREPGVSCDGDPVADLSAVVRADPSLGPPLADTITALSIGEPSLDRLPPALHAARQGDARPLRRLVAAAAAAQKAPAEVLSAGLHAATLCADSPSPWGGPGAPAPRRDATLARLRRTLPPAATRPFPASTATDQGLARTCALWPPIPPPPAPGRRRIRAPAVLVNGDRDLSTPLEWARAQARAMSRARLVVVHGAGHSIVGREAGSEGRAAVAAFLSSLR